MPRAPKKSVRPRKPAALDPVAELEQLRAAVVLDLPIPLTLWLEVPGAPVPVCFTSAKQAQEASVLSDRIVFHRDEAEAIFTGAQLDRVWRKELLGFCFEKWRRPTLRISLDEVLGGAMPGLLGPDDGWTLGEVLARLGVRSSRVELHEPSLTDALCAAA